MDDVRGYLVGGAARRQQAEELLRAIGLAKRSQRRESAVA